MTLSARREAQRIGWTTAAFIALVLIGAGCHTSANAPYEFTEGSHILTLAPRADGVLEVVDRAAFASGSGAEHVVDAAPTGGISRTLASLQGDISVVSASFTSAPLERTHYFDLDQQVSGQLFISNSRTVNGESHDSLRIITELYVDGAFAGGAYYEHSVQSTIEEWNPVPVYFRPETNVLPAGSVVELRISFQNGLADVKLGIGGDHASRVELAYYPYDPLAGAVFLEKGKLVSALSDDNTTGQESTRLALEFMEPPEFDALPPGHYVVRGGILDDAPHVQGVPGHPGTGQEVAADDVTVVSQGGHAPSAAADGHDDHSHDFGTSDSVGIYAMLLALPLLLVGLVGRFPPRRLLPVLVVALMVFAGCAGPKNVGVDGEDPDAPKPRVDSKFEDVDDEEEAAKQTEAGVGTVKGIVTNYFGIPVTGAHVSILATNKFTSTETGGEFRIPDIPAGKYTMRVDADELESLEREIEVQVAKVTDLRITLIPPNGTRADQIQHLHDEWRGAQRKALDEVVVEADTHVYTSTQEGGGRCLNGYWVQGSYGTNSQAGCRAEANFDFSKKVLPGTAIVEVTLNWDDSGSNVPALGVSYANSLRSDDQFNQYLPRGPGETFWIHVFPNQADPGHQEFSNWQFYIFFYGSDDVPRDAPYDIPPVTVTAHIHKGIVPFEPKHHDRWGDKKEMVLQDGITKRNFNCAGCTVEEGGSYQPEQDGWISNGGASWTVLKDGWVAPGTARVEGVLIKDPNRPNPSVTVPDPPHIEYGLGYKPASVPTADFHGNLVIVPVEETSEGLAFSFTPGPKELDQWYQSGSQWTFYLLTKTDVNPYYSSHGFRLEAKAIKDPNWTFDDEE